MVFKKSIFLQEGVLYLKNNDKGPMIRNRIYLNVKKEKTHAK